APPLGSLRMDRGNTGGLSPAIVCQRDFHGKLGHFLVFDRFFSQLACKLSIYGTKGKSSLYHRGHQGYRVWDSRKPVETGNAGGLQWQKTGRGRWCRDGFEKFWGSPWTVFPGGKAFR